MRNHNLHRLIFLILLSQTITVYSQIQILSTGKFQGSEITAKSGEVWYGLFQTTKGTELRQCQITVKPIRDVSNNDRPNQKTGKQVTINQPDQPLLLVKGIPNLQSSPIITVHHRKEFLRPNQPLTFSPPYQNYQLKASGNTKDLGNITKIENYAITLCADETTQLIVQYKYTFPGMGEPNLIWAGDLDRDDELDLLIDLSNSHTRSEYGIFLSSKAQNHELVGKPVTFKRVVD